MEKEKLFQILFKNITFRKCFESPYIISNYYLRNKRIEIFGVLLNTKSKIIAFMRQHK